MKMCLQFEKPCLLQKPYLSVLFKLRYSSVFLLMAVIYTMISRSILKFILWTIMSLPAPKDLNSVFSCFSQYHKQCFLPLHYALFYLTLQCSKTIHVMNCVYSI